MSLNKFLEKKLQNRQEKKQEKEEIKDEMKHFLKLCDTIDAFFDEEIKKVCDEKGGCNGLACDGCVGQVHPGPCDVCKCTKCSCCNGYYS